jgi:hypothetical protein
MKKIIFFSACLFVADNCFAQASKIDLPLPYILKRARLATFQR